MPIGVVPVTPTSGQKNPGSSESKKPEDPLGLTTTKRLPLER